MKRYKIIIPAILVITAILLIIASIAYINKDQKTDVLQMRNRKFPDFVNQAEARYAPGELIIKIKPDVKKNFAKIINNANPKNALLGDTELYELGKYDIREVKHLFSNYTFTVPQLTQKQKEAVRKREQKMPWQKEYMPKIREKLSRVLLLKCDPGTDIESLAKDIEQKCPYVEYAEPNYICYLTEYPETLPNDTYVDPDGDNEWSFGAWGQDYEDMWGLRAINIKPEDSTTTVWSLSQGEGIVVGVVDSGIDYTHEDLEENIWINPGELPDDFDSDGDGAISFDECIAMLEDYNGDGVINLKDLFGSPYEDYVDDDANGFVDDIIGWNFENNNNDPFDGSSHGTSSAGIIGAVGNNGEGIIGVAPKAKLMAVRSNFTTSNAIQCIEYASDNGARVISNSWVTLPSDTLYDLIIQTHYIKGDIVVASAGNANRDAINYTPAKINEVIVVAAMEPNGRRAGYSNWGSIIDVIASADNTLSTHLSSAIGMGGIDDENKYRLFGGTSAACPFVSGLVALILSKNPSLTPEQINQIIRVSADDVTDPFGDGEDYAGFDIYTGYGLINAYSALQIDSALECRITEVNYLESQEIEIKGIVSGPNFASYSLEYQMEGEDTWNVFVIDDTIPHPYTLDIDGNPIFDTLGSFTRVQDERYIIRLSARDIYGNTYIDRYDAIQNRPPVLEPIGHKDIEVGETLTFTVSATDPDGDPLTYTARTGPYIVGTVFSDQIFTWTPTPDLDHRYTWVAFTVSDGALIDYETVVIYIGNQPPSFNRIGPQSVYAGETLTFRVSATDRENDPLTYRIGGYWLGEGDYINGPPSNAVFSDQTFTWTPAYDQTGTYTVTFTVSDGESIRFLFVDISVYNRPPELLPIGDKIVYRGQTLSFIVSTTDTEGETLTYTIRYMSPEGDYIDGPPPGTTFSDQTFTWTPTPEQPYITYRVEFTVSDGELSDSEEINIVYTNALPVLEPIGDKSVDEGQTLTFTVSATDHEGETLSYTILYFDRNIGNFVPIPPPGAEFSEGVFTWTPSYRQAGSYWVGFYVSDGLLLPDGTPRTVDEWITITVNNANGTPVLEPIGDKSADEDQLLTFTVSASDPDGDALTYTATGLPPGADFIDQVFRWRPSYEHAGIYTVTFTVSDGALFDSETITITVNNVNRPPVLGTIGDKNVDEGQPLDFTISAEDYDGDSITYSAIELPSGATFNPDTRTFSWTPAYDQAGSYTVTFTVSDGTLTDSETINITVNNINRAPVLDTIGDKSVNENQILTFMVSAADPDGDTLLFSAIDLPAGASLNSTTGEFTWTPSYAQAGSYRITFTVSDANMTDSETITITVNNINLPPVLSPIGDKVVDENTLLEFTISAEDPNGDALTYITSSLPAGAIFSDHTFTWTPTYEQAGSYTVIFIITDGAGLTDSEIIIITVNNISRPPVLTPIGDKSVDERRVLTFIILAEDPDGDSLTYSASGLPRSASFNPATRTFSWRPSYAQAGAYSVTFTATDGELSSSETITITVNNINRPPRLLLSSTRSVFAGSELVFIVSATDPDGDRLTYTADTIPEGASFNAATRIFRWRPTDAQAGIVYTVRFTVSDNGTPILSNSKNVRISVLRRPRVR